MKYRKLHVILPVILASLVILTMFGISAVASQKDPSVVFDQRKQDFDITGAEKFEHENGIVHTNFDLFPDLKGVMPGDTVRQSIKVGVKNVQKDCTIRLSLRSEPAILATETETEAERRAYEELLEHAVLTVRHGEEEITGSLQDGVLLGAYKRDTMSEVDVELAVDVQAGNELAGLTASIDWIFTAEVIDDSKPPFIPKPPEKDDEIHLNTSDHFAYIIGYPDGGVHPEGNITRAEVATIFFRLLTEDSRNAYWAVDNDYTDVSRDDWFNTAVSTLSYAGIIHGYPDGTFRPNAKITRAEFTTIAVRFFDTAFEGSDRFSDIDEHWAQEYINKASEQNLVQGYEDGTFKPQKEITRAEAVTITNRALGRQPDKNHLLDDMIMWPDNMDTEKWYYAQVQEATNSHEYIHHNQDVIEQEIEHGHYADAAKGEYEIWKKLLPVRDWAELEASWTRDHDVYNPGEVTGDTYEVRLTR